MTRLLIAALIAIGPGMVQADEKKKEEKAPVEKVRTFAVEEVILQMFLDYKAIENAVSAAKGNEFKRGEAREEWTKKWNDKWAGKKLRISGKVDSVIPWLQPGSKVPDRVAIRMEGKQTFRLNTFVWQMEFHFPDPGDFEKAKKVDAGKKATIEGTVKSIDGENWVPMYFEDCHIVSQADQKKKAAGGEKK